MTVLQQYGTSKTFVYTPTTVGTYTIRAFVRNEGNTAAYEAVQWLTYNVTSNPP